MRKVTNYKEFVSSNVLKNELDKKKLYHYDLQIFDDDFRFTLAIPPGEIIEDDFEGLYKRSALYKQLEGGEIFEWLSEIHFNILIEQNQAAVDS